MHPTSNAAGSVVVVVVVVVELQQVRAPIELSEPNDQPGTCCCACGLRLWQWLHSSNSEVCVVPRSVALFRELCRELCLELCRELCRELLIRFMRSARAKRFLIESRVTVALARRGRLADPCRQLLLAQFRDVSRPPRPSLSGRDVDSNVDSSARNELSELPEYLASEPKRSVSCGRRFDASPLEASTGVAESRLAFMRARAR